MESKYKVFHPIIINEDISIKSKGNAKYNLVINY